MLKVGDIVRFNSVELHPRKRQILNHCWKSFYAMVDDYEESELDDLKRAHLHWVGDILKHPIIPMLADFKTSEIEPFNSFSNPIGRALPGFNNKRRNTFVAGIPRMSADLVRDPDDDPCEFHYFALNDESDIRSLNHPIQVVLDTKTGPFPIFPSDHQIFKNVDAEIKREVIDASIIQSKQAVKLPGTNILPSGWYFSEMLIKINA